MLCLTNLYFGIILIGTQCISGTQLYVYSKAIKNYALPSKCKKSSAVAEMGNRLATIGMGRKWGGAAVGGWVPI